jgi:predicted DNA-binding transcriptional regulator AlpA
MPRFVPSRRRFLSPRQLADSLGVSESALYVWRKLGAGPDFVRLRRVVRYDVQDVESWLAQKREGVAP